MYALPPIGSTVVTLPALPSTMPKSTWLRVCRRMPSNTLPSRDPSHSVDLMSKDLAKSDVLGTIIKKCDKYMEVCNIDRLDNIKKKMV